MDDADGAGAGLGSIRDLHDAYAGQLFAFAVRRLGDRQAAEEVVQDALVRAWRAADRFDPHQGTAQAWLFTITRNLVVDRVRARAARPGVAELPADAPDAAGADELDRLLETWQVAEALAGLSDAHRDALVLCHHRGHTVVEAARVLGVPPGTVKSRLFYGLRALRLRLEEMGVVR